VKSILCLVLHKVRAQAYLYAWPVPSVGVLCRGATDCCAHVVCGRVPQARVRGMQASCAPSLAVGYPHRICSWVRPKGMLRARAGLDANQGVSQIPRAYSL
jgi:hypothetical protein